MSAAHGLPVATLQPLPSPRPSTLSAVPPGNGPGSWGGSWGAPHPGLSQMGPTFCTGGSFFVHVGALRAASTIPSLSWGRGGCWRQDGAGGPREGMCHRLPEMGQGEGP